MTKPSAFSATYSDWKLIRSRSVVQVVFEVPLEMADQAYSALGGMPSQGETVWCGIARLKAPVGDDERPVEKEVMPHGHSDARPRSETNAAGGAKRSWHDISPAQQAGILCNEESFVTFIREEYIVNAQTPEDAAKAIRHLCGVRSRKDISAATRSGAAWATIVSRYRAWMREPEVVG